MIEFARRFDGSNPPVGIEAHAKRWSAALIVSMSALADAVALRGSLCVRTSWSPAA